MFNKRPFFRKFNRRPVIKANEYIRATQIQLIDETGKNLGITETAKGLEMAQERGLDLVEISSKTDPPICKIIDKGKYQYIQEKKEKKQKAKQKTADLKEIRIGYTTSLHDSEIKAKQIEGFLKDGHKVKIEIRLRGRERAFGQMAKEKLEKFLELISVEYKREEETKKSSFGLNTIICQGKPKNQ